jgi:tRNA threonylcarbamoyladenosine biosynthesis protein TsaB
LILFSSELEFELNNITKMNKLIIDVVGEKIFLMIITSSNIYNICYENTKINFEKLTIIISDFLISYNLKITDINIIYINKGPGSFAGIRNSLSIVKAFNVAKKIDYYCYSMDDFKGETDVRYENIPNLCDKYKIKKNLINPIYLS